MTIHPHGHPTVNVLSFNARRDGHFRKDFDLTPEIYVMDADGGLNRDSLKIAGMTFHPPGPLTVNGLPSQSDRKGDFVNYEIYVMDADGGNQRKLTQ